MLPLIPFTIQQSMIVIIFQSKSLQTKVVMIVLIMNRTVSQAPTRRLHNDEEEEII